MQRQQTLFGYGSKNGFHEAQQSLEEFAADVHVVARNFAGEQDWRWCQEVKSEVATSKGERFTEEMTTDTESISNLSRLDERIALGLVASLYFIPYLAGRVIYEGLLDAYAYGAVRIQGLELSPLERHKLKPRQRNAYFIGLPLGLPLIATLAVSETVARAGLGISPRASEEMLLAWRGAGFFARRWTKSKYSIEDYKQPLKNMLKAPKNFWEVSDCIGLGTGGLALSLSIFTLGTAFAATLASIETLGRGLGLSQVRPVAEAKISIQTARLLLARWLDACTPAKALDEHSAYQRWQATLQTQWPLMKAKPQNYWEVLDCVGMATGGLALATTITVGSAGLSLSLAAAETVARAGLGFSKRGLSEVIISFLGAAALTQRWTRQLKLVQPDTDYLQMCTPFAKCITAKPKSYWDYADCVGLATGGLALAVSVYLTGVAVAVSLGSVELFGRSLGLSKRTPHELRLALLTSVWLFKRWSDLLGLTSATHSKSWEQDFDPDYLIITEQPQDLWEIADCVGLATGGLALSLALMAPGAVIGGTLAFAESLSRCLGLSPRGLAAFQVMFSDCRSLFTGTYCQKDALYPSILDRSVHSWWDACDVVGTVFAAATVITGALVLMGPLSLVGLSKANYHRFNLYRHQFQNYLSERKGQQPDRSLENYHRNALAACETTPLGKVISYLNFVNLATQILSFTLRWIIAPALYALARLSYLLMPPVFLTKLVHACTKPRYDLRQPQDRVRKRLADLHRVIDVKGHFELGPEPDRLAKVPGQLEQVKQRTLAGRAKFGLFTETRKVMGLGSSVQEQVLGEFEKRFNEFLSVRRNAAARNQAVPSVKGFFSAQVQVRGEPRFEYEHMVERLKRKAKGSDRGEIDEIAMVLKQDLEEQMDEPVVVAQPGL